MPPSTPHERPRDAAEQQPGAQPRNALSERQGRPWKRIFGSFLLVLGIYGVYSVVAVPLIEPPAAPRQESEEDITGIIAGRNAPERQRVGLQRWFKPGDWELKSPNVVELRQAKLLFHEYKTQADGRVHVHPCTVIFLSAGENLTEEESARRAVIMQAPEGAILTFDSKVDLTQLKLGKLVGGLLQGAITIRSDQRLPGPEDDLLIRARDVELKGDKVISSHPVDFQLGPNQGNGRDLEIHLMPSTIPHPGGNAPNFDGISSFALKKDVRMWLEPGRSDIFPGLSAHGKPPAVPAPTASPVSAVARVPLSATPAAPGLAGAARGRENPPVEIKCNGIFYFDALRYTATFKEQVDVKRINIDGPFDQMTCEVLTLHFEPAAPADGAPAGAVAQRKGLPKLEPSRVEATGNPVIIRSPSRKVQARGQRLDYDIKRNSGSLSGPGWLKGSVPDDAAARPLEATWKRQLAFAPDQETQRLSVEGAAHVEVVGTGAITAEGIYLYLIEQIDPSPQAAGRKRWVPVRLQATSSVGVPAQAASAPTAQRLRRGVRLQSPQASGDVNLLQVWFTHVAPVVPEHLPAPAAPATAAPSPVAAPLVAQAAPATPRADQHFHLDGDLLRIEALVRDRRTELSRVHAEGHVQLAETRVAEPGARPLLVRGDKIDVEQSDPLRAMVWVVGRPAHVEARELGIDGGKITVDRGHNTAAVEGPGLMTYLVMADLSGRPISQPQTLELTWRGGMLFDGQSATFEDRVVGRLEGQRLNTTWLRAIFDRPVSFSQPAPAERPQINRVLCRGETHLERRVVEQGKPVSLERMKAADLTVEPLTGNVLAGGPGWVRSVRVDNGRGLALPGAQPAAAKAAPPPKATQGPKLAFLGVHFDGSLTGNQQRQVMDFTDRVRCAYGPAADWDTVIDPDEPDRLGESDAIMTCDGLQVVQVPAAPGVEPTFQLQATGNARVEGQTYSARATRLSFDQGKDQLVLEGNGRSDATLTRQERIGSPPSTINAGKIFFWPSTNHLQLQDGHQMSVENLRGSATGDRR